MSMKTIILAFIFLIGMKKTYAAIENSQKPLAFPNYHDENWVFDVSNSLTVEKFPYAWCDYRIYDVKKCSVKLYTTSGSCEVKLHARPSERFGEIINLIPFSHDKAIIVWREDYRRSATKITTIKFVNCENSETLIFNERDVNNPLLKSILIVTYNKVYDVLHTNSQCSPKLKRLRIDENGNILSSSCVSNPEVATSTQKMYPVDRNSPDDGIFYVKTGLRDSNHAFTILKPDGTKQILAERTNEEVRGITTAHGLITVCSQSMIDKTITCLQYDASGELKLEKTFNGQSTYIWYVHNTPENGFILVVSKCQPAPSCFNKIDRYSVLKINRTHVMSLDDLEKCDGKASPVILFDSKDGKYCIRSVCYDDYGLKRLDIFDSCFHETDLSSYKPNRLIDEL